MENNKSQFITPEVSYNPHLLSQKEITASIQAYAAKFPNRKNPFHRPSYDVYSNDGCTVILRDT